MSDSFDEEEDSRQEAPGPAPRRRKAKRKRFGPKGQAAFVRALATGASVAAAARAAGFCTSTLYSARARSAPFRAAWDEAAEASSGYLLIAPHKGRRLQARRVRRRLFTPALQDQFLEHFATSCNIAAAAEATGIGRSTVNAHLLKDPDFRARFEAALQLSYLNLEAETLRRRTEALARPWPKGDGAGPAEEDFDRALQLRREHKRNFGDKGRRPGRPLTNWNFEDAFEALEKQLKAFGVRVAAGEYDEEGE
jgi:hypothetical protein